jgi:ankyrin repeat protein
MIVEEGGADADARDQDGETPLGWLQSWYAHTQPQVHNEALDLLVRLGADVNARDLQGNTPIFSYVRPASLPSLLRLLDLGASVDVQKERGAAPLMRACTYGTNGDVLKEVLRRSSIDTLRATRCDGWRAHDIVAHASHLRDPPPWIPLPMPGLLRAGVPFKREHAPCLLPIAASFMKQQELDLEIFRSGRLLWDWRGHEAMVGLAFEQEDARCWERRVAEREADVRRLEAELRALEKEKARRRGGGRGVGER